MSKKNTPSPCKTCSKTFCSDNGPCGIREKKVCSSYLGSKPLEDMANEAILSIENGV